METERKWIRDQLLNSEVQEHFVKKFSTYISKTCDLSTKARQEGNELYARKDHNGALHKEILNLYSKSVAFAPDRTEELALAYGNRSALLLHLKKYKESVEDIDRALNIAKSTGLKVKLLCRKVECLTALGSPENQIVFDTAVENFNDIPKSDKSRENLNKLIVKTATALEFNQTKALPVENENLDLWKAVTEKEKAGAFNSVGIRYSEKYGRYLVATQNFNPGDIIYVEKP